MNLWKKLLTGIVAPLAILTLSACAYNKPDSYLNDSYLNDSYLNDPYGIIEAEQNGELSDRLVQCSQYEQCPEYAEALFWVAIDILSDASAETIEIEEIILGLTRDMSIKEMEEKIESQLDSLYNTSPPNFSKDKTGFNRGFAMLLKAHNAGSIYAANELGRFYMEREEMQDLGIAQTYFESSIERRDFLGAYNLARLVHIQNPNDHRSILKYLKIATKTGDKQIEIAYNLGLDAFGTEAEKQVAALYFKENTIIENYISENFKSDFSLQ